MPLDLIPAFARRSPRSVEACFVKLKPPSSVRSPTGRSLGSAARSRARGEESGQEELAETGEESGVRQGRGSTAGAGERAAAGAREEIIPFGRQVGFISIGDWIFSLR